MRKEESKKRVDHDVADEVNPLAGHTFLFKVRIAVLGGCKQNVRDTIRYDSIDLLRHRPIERSKAGFHVAYCNKELGAH